MSYYSNFNLYIHTPEGDDKDYEAEICTNENVSDLIKNLIEQQYIFEKWYNFEEDMQNLSLLYPDLIFELNIEGQDRDDNSCMRFKNGQKEAIYAKIAWEEFKTILLESENNNFLKSKENDK